jgi:hypothetical protein
MAKSVSDACLIAALILLRATALRDDARGRRGRGLRGPTEAAVEVPPKAAEPPGFDDGVGFGPVAVEFFKSPIGVGFGIALGIGMMALVGKSITRTKLEKADDQQLNTLQRDLRSLTQDVARLREDNASLKQEIRSLKAHAGMKDAKSLEDLTKLITDVVNAEMHSICAQEGSSPMKEFSPTRPEMTPFGGDDDQGGPCQEEIRQQDFDEPKRYRVVHKDLVYIREDHNADSADLSYKSCGDVVLATGEVNDWLKLADEGGWMLKDGEAQGLGLLLEPVAE